MSDTLHSIADHSDSVQDGATTVDSASRVIVTFSSPRPLPTSGATVSPQSSSEATGAGGMDEIPLPAVYSTETISFPTFVTETISDTINSRASTETTMYELVMVTSASDSQIVISTLATLARSGNESTPILTELGPGKTVTSNSSSAPTVASSTKEASHHSAVVGIGVGVPLGVLGLAILVYLLWRHKRKTQSQGVKRSRLNRSPYEKPEMEDTGKARMEMDISGIHELEASANPQSSRLAELEATHGSSELITQAVDLTPASCLAPTHGGKTARQINGINKHGAC